jgi:hypothetical protein
VAARLPRRKQDASAARHYGSPPSRIRKHPNDPACYSLAELLAGMRETVEGATLAAEDERRREVERQAAEDGASAQELRELHRQAAGR